MESRPTEGAALPKDERDSLTTRIIPRMTLSTAANPLTAPIPVPHTLSQAHRALERFRIHGAAIITGGAGTLALASARALLEHGSSAVCLMDLPSTFKSSQSAVNTLKADFDEKIATVECDVTDPVSTETAFDEAERILAGHLLTTLCCFHGVVGCVPSLDVNASEFQRVISVNLTGSFGVAQMFARLVVRQNKRADLTDGANSDASTYSRIGASILFTSSISSHAVNFPQPQLAYNVSKSGVSALTRNLAAEWAVHGIRVNCLCPGYMDTILNAGDNLQEIRDMWASRNPMGRMGDVEEITGTVVSLCAPKGGRYITGTEVVVDGGGLCL